MEDDNLIVIRAEHETNYKAIDLTCVNDKRLSWKAKGIFNYLVTRPPLWVVNLSDLIKRSNDGKSSLYSGIKELIEAGYVFRIVKRIDNKIVKWAYLTTEISCSSKEIIPFIPEGYILYFKKLFLGNQEIGNHQRNNKDFINNKDKDSSSNEDSSLNNKPSKEGLHVGDVPNFSDKFVDDKVKKSYKVDMASYSPDVQNLYDLWQSLGSPIKQHRNGSKTNHQSLCELKKAVKLHDPSKIADAMLLYYKIISSAQDYKLSIRAPGNLIGLNEFFRFSDFTRSRIDKKNCAYDIQSWFDECLKGEIYIDRIYAKYKVEDVDPEITNELKKNWKKYFETNPPNSPNDEDCFRLATQKFKQFMKRHRKNYRLYDNISIDNLKRDSKYLFEALINATNDIEKITPAWLCSETMFKKRFPFYLIDQGMMDNEFEDKRQEESSIVSDIYKELYGE